MELETSLAAPGDWQRVTIENVCVKFTSGGTPSRQRPEFYQDGTVPWIKTKELLDVVLQDAEERITEEAIAHSSAKRLPRNTVLMAMYGATVGQLGILGKEMACNQACAAMVADDAKCDYRFLYYVLLANRRQIVSMATGAAQQNLSGAQIKGWTIALPEREEQRAIAHILGTLDDKIELNRRMSETLEQMARALFKAWFVDFEPVRAKMEGRWQRGQSLPGLPAHLYDLFPDRLVESELGEIPEGWVVKKLSDLCSTQYGYTASAVAEPVGPKFLRVTDINKRNWIEWDDVPHCVVDPDTKTSYALQLGDLVVARMADPGKSAIIEEATDAVFASYLVRLKTASLAHSYYVYGFLKSDLYAEYAEGAKSGSVQANMNAKVIVGASLAVPPTTVLEQFLKAVLTLRQRLVRNVRDSRTLAQLRDTLLPKLISGELRVPEAEKFLEKSL